MMEEGGWHVFTFREVPVALAPSFFLIALFMFWQNGPVTGSALCLAYLASIFIHEYGHAFVSKRLRLEPSIVIHGMGGYCLHRPASTDGQDALVTAMGPLLQIWFGVLTYGSLLFFDLSAGLSHPILIGFADSFFVYFYFISIFWGALNLLIPIWPLDGGKLLHLILRRFLSPERAQVWTIRSSIGILLPLGLFAITNQHLFGMLIVFFLVRDNIRVLQWGRPIIHRGAGKRGGKRQTSQLTGYAKELFERAEQCFEEENWREAARLCHQIRASAGHIPENQLMRIWEILGLSHMQMAQYPEALAFLKRAPQNDAVRAAWAHSLAAIEQK